MSLEKARKSDRFQIIAAVLFMGLFAALLLVITLPKNSITSFVCSYTDGAGIFAQICANQPSTTSGGTGQFVPSRIDLACVDDQGLKISIRFDQPLTGAADIQVFSTGPDFFPSGQGMTDTYEVNQTLSTAVDHLDLVIPVDAMLVGEQIFGNMVVSEEDFHTRLAYLLEVSDCSTDREPSVNSPMGVPVIQSATCLPGKQLMIAFEFERPVLGQYQVLVDEIPYQLSSVVSQPAILFFTGKPPDAGPVLIRLVSATDEVIVFEETYTPPVCGNN
jgi:hypothetical protein